MFGLLLSFFLSGIGTQGILESSLTQKELDKYEAQCSKLESQRIEKSIREKYPNWQIENVELNLERGELIVEKLDSKKYEIQLGSTEKSTQDYKVVCSKPIYSVGPMGEIEIDSSHHRECHVVESGARGKAPLINLTNNIKTEFYIDFGNIHSCMEQKIIFQNQTAYSNQIVNEVNTSDLSHEKKSGIVDSKEKSENTQVF